MSAGRGERHLALDVARGFAVFGMIYVHLVPTEGAGSAIGNAATWLARFLEGRSAALFCILAGCSWAIQAARAEGSERFSRYVGRRVLALLVMGLLFHIIWPTEILIPLAIMMLLALGIRTRGWTAVAAAAVLLVAAAPLSAALFHVAFVADWRPDGGHVADSSLGWATLRFYFIDGNYPVVPWLAYPLLGILLLAGDTPRAERARSWFWIALLTAALVQALKWTDTVETSWVPTNVPFLLLTAGSAMTALAGLLWWNRAGRLPLLLMPVAKLGRASLTHYIIHVAAVIVPLRMIWPDEDWPVRIGAAAFLGYVVLAVPLTAWWFRRRTHGPLEGLWARASGPSR